MKRKIVFISTGLIVLIGVIASTASAQTWTGPTQSPPNANASTPINTGSSAQVKNGSLTVNAFSALLNSYFAQNA